MFIPQSFIDFVYGTVMSSQVASESITNRFPHHAQKPVKLEPDTACAAQFVYQHRTIL